MGMKPVSKQRAAAPASAPVVAKALLRAGERLSLSNKALGRIVGLSEASMSRLGKGSYGLVPGDKSFEMALLFIRLFRSLDAIVGGDEAVARAWLKSENATLGGRPLDLIQTVSGLVDVLGYLDARRALV